MENIHNGEVNIQKLESLNKVSINKENEMKVIKICINEDTYRKIKSFGILLGLCQVQSKNVPKCSRKMYHFVTPIC